MKTSPPLEKVLIIGPILPEWSAIHTFSKSFEFLKSKYELDVFDPLWQINGDTSCEIFLSKWRSSLAQAIVKYKALIGFSLGGVILHQCFDIFEKYDKPIILCSTPSFIHGRLKERLLHIINLANDKSLSLALSTLNKYVYFPNNPPSEELQITNIELAALRLLKGLDFVSNINSVHMLQDTKVKYLHLIGEKSGLVSKNDIITTELCKLIIVPNTGMRVLESDPIYYLDTLLEFLRGRF